MHMEVRGKLRGVISLLPHLWGSQGPNSGHQNYEVCPLPDEPTILWVLYLGYLRQGLLPNPELPDWLDCWPLDSRDLPMFVPSLVLGLHACAIMLRFYVGSGECRCQLLCTWGWTPYQEASS